MKEIPVRKRQVRREVATQVLTGIMTGAYTDLNRRDIPARDVACDAVTLTDELLKALGEYY